MGAWGTALFSDDTACDIRDAYKELIEDGIDDAEATQTILNSYAATFNDPEDEDQTVALLALAVTQSKIGRLDPAIRDRALAALDTGHDLERWAQDSPKDVPKRKAQLEKARAQITGPQPPRKRLRPPKRWLCDLVVGDVLALDLPTGPVLFRTVYVSSSRYGETPILEELAVPGSELPATEAIQHLPARATDVLFDDDIKTFDVMLGPKNAGWQAAGFSKIANIPSRPGDELLQNPDSGTSWPGLAHFCQKRSEGKGF